MNGYVGAYTPGLARAANVPVEAVRLALEKFMGPDPDSRNPDNEGRRLEKVDGGWRFIDVI